LNDARGSNNTRCIDLFRNENGPMNGKQCILKRSVENTKSLSNRDPERRSYPRYQLHKIVSYTLRGKELLTVTMDLGMGGMKIKTHHALPKNERLKFKMVLGNNSIFLEGRVVYSESFSDEQSVSGIQFIELSTENSALLQKYLISTDR